MSYTVTNSDIHVSIIIHLYIKSCIFSSERFILYLLCVQQQTPQLNQLLTSGQTGNYVNKPVQPNVAQRDLVPNPYRNVPSTNNAGKTDDDIIEV
jgi:hypothetical protein